MIDLQIIGKTSYGGKIFSLEADKFFEIPALRCVISTGKIKKREVNIEEAIDYFNKNPLEAKKLVERVYSKYRHQSIGEFSTLGIYLKDTSRLFNFVGWIPIGAPRGVQGVGTEKSLRRTRPRNYVEVNPKLNFFNENAFQTYQELVNSKLPEEDARYVLPLSTKSEEIMQIPLGRELGKWSNYLMRLPFKETREVGKALYFWNYEMTGIRVEEIPSDENFMPLKSEEKSFSRKIMETKLKSGDAYYDTLTETLVMRIKGSIASFHQEVRDRQELLRWPSWEEVVFNDKCIIPRRLKKRARTLGDVYDHSYIVAGTMWKEGNYEAAVLCQPLGKEMDVISTIHGRANIKYTFMLRTCLKAQEEIRERFLKVAKKVEKNFGEKLGPRCETEGICYEWGKEKCEKFKKIFA